MSLFGPKEQWVVATTHFILHHHILRPSAWAYSIAPLHTLESSYNKSYEVFPGIQCHQITIDGEPTGPQLELLAISKAVKDIHKLYTEDIKKTKRMMPQAVEITVITSNQNTFATLKRIDACVQTILANETNPLCIDQTIEDVIPPVVKRHRELIGDIIQRLAEIGSLTPHYTDRLVLKRVRMNKKVEDKPLKNFSMKTYYYVRQHMEKFLRVPKLTKEMLQKGYQWKNEKSADKT